MTILGKMEQYAKEGINLLQKIVGLLKEIKTMHEHGRSLAWAAGRHGPR